MYVTSFSYFNKRLCYDQWCLPEIEGERANKKRKMRNRESGPVRGVSMS